MTGMRLAWPLFQGTTRRGDPMRYRTIDVDGLDVFYREAGDPGAPNLLLLHGFPSSSHMFRDLIPLLADRFRILAPDLPGFGRTAMPERGAFAYTFDNLARVVERFTELVGWDRFAVYVFDYGAPTGFRVAMRHPDRIAAIISQNGNAYNNRTMSDPVYLDMFTRGLLWATDKLGEDGKPKP